MNIIVYVITIIEGEKIYEFESVKIIGSIV